jgi:trehalose utilization protein
MLAVSAAASAGLLLTPVTVAAPGKRQVVVWSEGSVPKDPEAGKVYPHDINAAVAEGLQPLKGWTIIPATLSDPDQGLGNERLQATDVLIWWGHKFHDNVKDELVERIYRRVHDEGMGFIGLHSTHFAKPFKRLMGTACSWREYEDDGTSVEITVKAPEHPIARGVKDFALSRIERYGEPFAVPAPETVVFEGRYTKPDGQTEAARMGLAWTVGQGRVFYFTPGHETFPDFFNPVVRQILRNAVAWAAPAK